MAAPRNAQKRDTNEKYLIKYGFNPYNVIVWQMDAAFGCDLLIFHHCDIEFVEIKNPDGVTKSGYEAMLTDNEILLKRLVESTGKKYWIIATLEDVVTMMEQIRSKCDGN